MSIRFLFHQHNLWIFHRSGIQHKVLFLKKISRHLFVITGCPWLTTIGTLASVTMCCGCWGTHVQFFATVIKRINLPPSLLVKNHKDFPSHNFELLLSKDNFYIKFKIHCVNWIMRSPCKWTQWSTRPHEAGDIIWSPWC